MNSHERAFVEAFVYAPRRERFLAALENPKRRRVFTDELCHPSPQPGSNFLLFVYASPVERSKDKPAMIAERLRQLGAPELCHVIGEHLDGQDLTLDDALQEVVGYGYGVVLSCVPGKLAYLETENGRWIFHKA